MVFSAWQSPGALRLFFQNLRPSRIRLELEGARRQESTDRCDDGVGIFSVRCAKQPAGAIPQVQRDIICRAPDARSGTASMVKSDMSDSRASVGLNFQNRNFR